MYSCNAGWLLTNSWLRTSEGSLRTCSAISACASMNMSKLAKSRMVVSLSGFDCARAGLPIQNRVARLNSASQRLGYGQLVGFMICRFLLYGNLLLRVQTPCQLQRGMAGNRTLKQLALPTGSCSRENRHQGRKFAIQNQLEENLSPWEHLLCTVQERRIRDLAGRKKGPKKS